MTGVAEVTPTETIPSRRALVGACLGNAAEWYDFATYGAFATVIAGSFFPHRGPAALAAAFAIFATSFIARPLGAILVAQQSDRLGRRPALSRTIVMMTVATAAVGVLPPWSAIGFFAPAALLLLRLAQGFATGGEVPSSVAFLIESAPAGRRGRYGGWHMASIAAGVVGGYGIAGILSAALSEDALRSWGWRVGFLLAAPLGLTARYIRRRLEEPPRFGAAELPATGTLVGEILRTPGGGSRVGRGFLLVAALGLAFNLWFVFLPSHLAASGTVPLRQALGVGIVGLIATMVAAPVLGRLSDRVGRRPLVVVGTLGMAAFAGPGFILGNRSLGGAVVSELVMGVLIGTTVATSFVAELFPSATRASGVALTYGLATAMFGGTAPLVASLLFGSGVGWIVPTYLAVIALLALAAVFTAPETAFGKLT